jgi:hypothetical protein
VGNMIEHMKGAHAVRPYAKYSSNYFSEHVSLKIDH